MEGTTYPRMNRVFLTGLAQEEPELRYTPSGVSVCSFRVQVGRLLRDRSGGSREVAAYLTIVAWQETAQRMSRELHKGQAIYVEGYVSSRSFTTARGDKRTAIEIYAEQIQILGPFSEEGKAETEASARAAAPPAGSGGSRRGPALVRESAPRSEAQTDHPVQDPQKQTAAPPEKEAQQSSSPEAGGGTGSSASEADPTTPEANPQQETAQETEASDEGAPKPEASAEGSETANPSEGSEASTETGEERPES